jgi:hypothetical protein
MPNWCNNTVELYHEDPAMLERAREAFNKGALLHEFIPVPLCLTETMAGAHGDPEKQAALEKSEQDNLNAYNYKNWYDFCVAEWGTKWDVGGDGYPAQDIPGGLMLTFDSAWAPPTNAYERLMEQGFKIRAMYYEPGMAFAGIWEDGNDDYYEYGEMNSTEVADTLPAELDEAFCISESMAEYEEENQEIDLDGGLSATNEQEEQK